MTPFRWTRTPPTVLERRPVLEHWTEVNRIETQPDGSKRLKRTTCCCEAAGSSRMGCAIVAGNKTPCRCDCHRTIAPPEEGS